jgi:signal transduction histidine kinase
VGRADVSQEATLATLAEEYAVLRRVARLLAGGAGRDEVFEAVVGEVGRLIAADAGALVRFEGADAVVLGVWHASQGYSPGPTRHKAAPGTLAHLVLETGMAGRIDRYDDVTGSLGDEVRGRGWRSSVGAPIMCGGEAWGMMVVASTTGEPLPAGTEQRLTDVAELLAGALASAQGREDLRTLAEEQAALRQVATLVAEGASVRRLLTVVAELVARLLQVPLVTILRTEDDGAAGVCARSSTLSDTFRPGTRWALDGRSVIARVVDDGAPARIEDHAHLEGEIAAECRAAGIRSSVGSPIVVRGEVWGVLAASSTAAQPLPAATEGRLADFAALLATAISNADSRAEVDASRARLLAAADATRRRIERDLHDGAQQRLVTLALALRGVEGSVPAAFPDLRAQVARVADGLVGVVDDLRELARGIHPATLSEGGLVPAVHMLARRSATPVKLEIRCERRLPEPVEVAVYHVVSEALANTAKHAQASEVRIRIACVDDDVHVAVRDDGVGGAQPGRGSGLVSLKDRVDALGGRLVLQSPAGAGTVVLATLPCPRV